MLEAQQTADKTGRVLTDDEIIAQCVTFLGAGYDTSSTTLALTCYHLSLYPEIQDKVYDELVKCWPEDNQLNYDVVQKMIYLDQVISETLRVFPPGNIFTDILWFWSIFSLVVSDWCKNCTSRVKSVKPRTVTD